jgi:gas vesicle protein
VKPRSIVFAMALATVCSSTVSLWSQGGSSGSQSSGSSAPSASQGSATIENQIIAYDVLRQIAGKIAEKVKENCKCDRVLLPDPNSQSEIITARAFDVSVKALVEAYNGFGGGGAPSIIAAAVPGLSDIASLLTAIKSSATYSNQNFQPTTQSMVTLLAIELHKKNIAVRTTNLPGNLDDGVNEVQTKIGNIEDAQKRAKERVQKEPKEKDKDGKDKDPADVAALSDLDKEFSAFRTALAGTSPDGTVLATIIKGKTLLKPDSPPFSLLTVSVDAAGGDTKVTHLFWQELIMPTPSPSYTGGAVVSFLLTDQNSNFQDGDMFRFMYGWSKWKSPKFVLK